MPNTLPNEPLEITITESGRESLLFRALLRKAMHTLILGDKEQRNTLASLIATALDEATIETAEYNSDEEPNPFACDICGREDCTGDSRCYPPLAERIASDLSAERFGL
jgi:hypothetical protein